MQTCFQHFDESYLSYRMQHRQETFCSSRSPYITPYKVKKTFDPAESLNKSTIRCLCKIPDKGFSTLEGIFFTTIIVCWYAKISNVMSMCIVLHTEISLTINRII